MTGSSLPSHLITQGLETEVLPDTKWYKLTFTNNLHINYLDKEKKHKTKPANGINLPKIINCTIHQVHIVRNRSKNLPFLI